MLLYGTTVLFLCCVWTERAGVAIDGSAMSRSTGALCCAAAVLSLLIIIIYQINPYCPCCPMLIMHVIMFDVRGREELVCLMVARTGMMLRFKLVR
jgi:hypothetical protein